MKPPAQTIFAERAGRTLGRAWRGFVRLDQRVTGWLVGQGWAPGVAKVFPLVVKLAACGLLLYAAFWMAVLFMLAATAAWMARNSDHDESEEWAIGNQGEHKRSVFYDPINYNDDPDPRFEDER